MDGRRAPKDERPNVDEDGEARNAEKQDKNPDGNVEGPIVNDDQEGLVVVSDVTVERLVVVEVDPLLEVIDVIVVARRGFTVVHGTL